MADLASHPLLWRGKQVAHRVQATATGHTRLDEALPGNGWPLGAVTELISATPGCGELSLLLPTLARLSRQGHWISIVDPPWIPYPPALHAHGMALEKLQLIRTQNRSESLWACEQVVRGINGGALLAWPDSLSFSELRKLQLAAKSTRQTVFLFRGQDTANAPSPAALRLQLKPADGDLRIRVLKCRGQRPASAIHIRRSQLFQGSVSPAASSSMPDQHAGSPSTEPVTSLSSSRESHPIF